MTVKEKISALADQYYLTYANQSESTQKHKQRVITSFVNSLPEDIVSIRYADIQKWQDGLNPQNSVNTLNAYLITLRQFLTMVCNNGIETDFPVLLQKDRSYMPYLFTEDEITKLISFADNNISYSNDASSKTFCVPMILRLLAYCGLRERETLSIEIVDYDTENGVLLMKHTKGQKERYVPLHPTLAIQFTRYLQRICELFPHTEYAFPNDSGSRHITKGELTYEFDKIKKNAGLYRERIKHERTNCIHCLRHSFTVRSYTHLQTNEGDMLAVLSAYLGHKGIIETETYLKFAYRMFPKANDAFEIFSSDIWEGLSL